MDAFFMFTYVNPPVTYLPIDLDLIDYHYTLTFLGIPVVRSTSSLLTVTLNFLVLFNLSTPIPLVHLPSLS